MAFTVRRNVGVVGPMVIRPIVSIRSRALFLVMSLSGIALVVPSLDDVLALALPAKLQSGDVFWACITAVYKSVHNRIPTLCRNDLLLITKSFESVW